MQRYPWGAEEGGSEPHIKLPSPVDLHWTEKPPQNLALKTTGAYIQENWRAVGNWDSTLEGLMHKFPPSKSQCTGSSLKSTWAIREAESLTNFRVCAGGAGIWWNFLWGWKCKQAPFFFFLTLLQPRCPGAGGCLFCHSLSTLLTPGIPLRNRPTQSAHLSWLLQSGVCARHQHQEHPT